MQLAIIHPQAAALDRLRAALAGAPQLTLRWTAASAAEALQRCASQPPGLVLMDLELPEMSSAEAVRQLMAHSPCPVLMLSRDPAAPTREAYAALQQGALDIVALPCPPAEDGGRSQAELLGKIDQLRRLIAHSSGAASPPPPVTAGAAQHQRLLVVGGSTGAPGVLMALLRLLPRPLAWPMVVAQHIAPEFAAGMAAWLQRATGHPCVLALPGARLQAGTVHLSGRAGHLVLEARTRFAYSAQPADSPYQPSINRLFTSVAAGGPGGVAVLLSGMGSDGAEGLRALRSAGWRTFVQAPPSCVIDSMPRAALALQAAEHALPPGALAAALQAVMVRHGEPHVPTT